MDFTSLLKTVAPFLGTALGGPLGALAVTTATQALGLSDQTAEGLKNALAGASSVDLLALKKADQDFQVTLKTLDIKSLTDLETIAAGDRASARSMAVATQSSVPRNLTYFLTAGMTALMGALILKGIPDSGVVQLLLGNYVTAWLGSTVYWFGTSNSSAAKTQLLAKADAIKE